MPRFDIGLTRGVILILNLTILGLFGSVSWGFFVGKPNELDLELPDETRYATREAKGSNDSGRATEVIGLLFAEKPKKPIETPKTAPTEVKKQPTGGPLKDWKILNVITYPTCTVAFVFKGDDPEGGDSVTSAKSSSSRARRGSRTSRRRPTARGGKTSFESMIEGQTFKKDGHEVEIESITTQEVTYRTKGDAVFTIKRDNYEVHDYSDGLEGQDIDSETVPVRGAPEIDEDDKGRIEPGEKKKTSKKRTSSKKAMKKVDPKDDQ